VVRLAPGRHHPVRREPAEALRGHRQRHFYRDALPGIWTALRDVVLFWVGHGVRIFRVDNPHTQADAVLGVDDRRGARAPSRRHLPLRGLHPAQGDAQARQGSGSPRSYTYFTWRNNQGGADRVPDRADPVAVPRVPAPELLRQHARHQPAVPAGRTPAAFEIRAVLAGTLSSVWACIAGSSSARDGDPGTRGVPQLRENTRSRRGTGTRPGNIRASIARLNRIRSDNPALHELLNLRFYPAHSDSLLFYGKATADRDNIVWVAVNLDPHAVCETMIELPLHELGLGEDAAIEAEELRDGQRFQWRGRRQTCASIRR